MQNLSFLQFRVRNLFIAKPDSVSPSKTIQKYTVGYLILII